ncbi:hypothetical protein SULPSESMR1_02853 [Pseudosulfitobacter pseudonitzschiae]|uniref:Uncharacterized protein n=1 Tax=Pseudosulfitobacter pseudonitzschiae TaxID=1402135 RepID=A0A221K3U7_9RHOB|nr:hypothetical protein SULPSESMR1_02853 [Pseudosulfitobacter pseudonitzschiae]
MRLKCEKADIQKKGPPQNERGEVTNFRKNQFVGEYHLSYYIPSFRVLRE